MSPTEVILIVDDDLLVARALETVIRHTMEVDAQPMDLRLASTPESALHELEELAPDAHPVVISDFNLGSPSYDGMKLLQEVARRWPCARRVLMSGYPLRSFGGHLEDLDGFLGKPWEIEEIGAMMHGFLGPAPLAA